MKGLREGRQLQGPDEWVGRGGHGGMKREGVAGGMRDR